MQNIKAGLQLETCSHIIYKAVGTHTHTHSKKKKQIRIQNGSNVDDDDAIGFKGIVQDRTESSVGHEKQVQLISARCSAICYIVYAVCVWAQGAQFGQPVSPLSLSLSRLPCRPLSVLSAFAQGLRPKNIFVNYSRLDVESWPMLNLEIVSQSHDFALFQSTA